MNTQTFEITPEVIKTLTEDGVIGTMEALVEVGANKLPFDVVNVIIPLDVVAGVANNTSEYDGTEFDGVHIRMDNVGKGRVPTFRTLVNRGLRRWEDITHEVGSIRDMLNNDEDLPAIVTRVSCILVVLLATKNVTKTNLVSSGEEHDVNTKYTSFPVTKIRLSSNISDQDGTVVEGGSVRPHLRRGHVRNQKHGPNYSLTKKVFIEACVVMGDANFVETREKYVI